MKKLCLWLTLWLAPYAWSGSSQKVYASPDFAAEVIDQIPSQQRVRTLRESTDGEWSQISYRNSQNEDRTGWVRRPLKRSHRDVTEDRSPWSFGLGLGFFATEGESIFNIAGELRYLWNSFTETSAGLDLGLGSDSALGYRVGEKFFAPLSRTFVPYLYLGFRQFDVTEFKSSAYDPGIGFQYNSSSSSYFEVGLNMLIRKPFDQRRSNVVYLNAGTGFRF